MRRKNPSTRDIAVPAAMSALAETSRRVWRSSSVVGVEASDIELLCRHVAQRRVLILSCAPADWRAGPSTCWSFGPVPGHLTNTQRSGGYEDHTGGNGDRPPGGAVLR